jgi:hypothetical protein
MTSEFIVVENQCSKDSHSVVKEASSLQMQGHQGHQWIQLHRQSRLIVELQVGYPGLLTHNTR